MELLSLLFMSSCFLTLSRLTFGDQSGTSVFVKEGDDAILPCSLGTNENIEYVRFEWMKEGTKEEVFTCDSGVCYSPALPDRVSHFRDDLQHGNASIKIKNAQLEDEGIYTCSFPTSGKTFRIELVVGAAEPYVTSHDQINGGVLLQCDVKNANPKPTVEWRDSNNQIIHSEEPQVSKQGGRFYITLKATVEKNGRYRCVATQEKIHHQAQKEIHVHIYGGPVIVKDGADAILPCSLGTNENIEYVRFEWTKERTEKQVYIHDTGADYSPALPGRVSHFKDDLKNGNASIKINNVQLEDGGNYTCSFPTSGKTFRIELVVGAAEPYVTSHDQINGVVLLQCDVKNANPKPTVEWRDSNNQIIHSEEPQVSKQGDHVHITLKATVKKNGHYRCVATQEEIKHQTQKEIHVHIYEPNTRWKIVAVVAIVLAVAVVVGILVRRYFKNKKKTNKKECSAQELKLNADQSEPV
uniref:Ig-like domain-containing protein n=2 Tax=Oreochromis aureus TaxID=47969 RepID=A0A668ULV4_OREAU